MLFLLLISMRTARRRIWMAAACLFVTVDLFIVAQEINPRLPRSFFEGVPEAARALPADRDAYRIFVQPQWEMGGADGRLYLSHPRAAYYVVQHALLPPAPAAGV